MDTLYRNFTQRITRHFYSDNVLAELTALTITIKDEATGTVLTADSTVFEDLNILANKIEAGKYFASITPDSDESLGVYLVYWRATFSSEVWTEGPFVLEIRAEAEIPDTSDNYVSLDEIAAVDRRILELTSPINILREGERASRVLDSELDSRFGVPIRKRKDTKAYDQVIIQAASLLTAARIYSVNGYGDRSDDVMEDYRVLVENINSGKYRLGDEITEDEIGFSDPLANLADASTGIEIEINPLSVYSGEYHKLFIVEIQTGGDLGTATWRLSADGGGTWEESDIVTSDEWHYPTNGLGLGVRYYRPGSSGTLTTGDKWAIEARPLTDQVSPSGRSPRFQRIEL